MANNENRFLQKGEVDSEGFRAGFVEGYMQALNDTTSKNKLAKLRSSDLADTARVAFEKYAAKKRAMEEDGMKVVVSI